MLKISTIILLLLGVLALDYGRVGDNNETQSAAVGALHLFLDEERQMNIPVLLGILSLVISGALLIGQKS